jgi:hypothetical protein
MKVETLELIVITILNVGLIYYKKYVIKLTN